jgi:chaperone BCS1
MVAETKQKSASQLGVLLNFLDGVQEMHGSMILVTTNHPEKFDPALTRPGRLDTFHFEKLGPPEIAQFWRLYFDEDPPEDAPTSATVAELTTLMSRRTRKNP